MQSLGFILSLILHAAVIATAVWWSVHVPKPVDLNKPAYRVDLVTLAAPAPPAPVKAPEPVKQPETVKQPEPVKPEPKAEPVKVKKEEPKAKPISAIKKKKKKIVKKAKPKPKPKPKTAKQIMAEEMKKLRSKVAGEDRRKKQSVKSAISNLRKKEGKDVYATGDGSGQGGGSGLAEVYALIVGMEIKRNWRYPSFAGETNLQVTVEIDLAEDGRIMGSRIVNASGKPEFDNSALRAIRETETVEPPRTKRDRKIRINFNSQELSD